MSPITSTIVSTIASTMMSTRIVQYENTDVPILGYTYIDDPSLTVKQRKRFEQVTHVYGCLRLVTQTHLT